MSDYNKFDNMRFGIDPSYINVQWGKKKDIKPFIDKNPFNNLILSKTEQLTMNRRKGRRKSPLYQNSNVAVVGCCGSGKTYNVVKPNIYQLRNSYVVLDTKGVLLHDTGNLFREKGYNIYCLNMIDMNNSMHYNPFCYIREPNDIITLANVLYTNLKPTEDIPCDPFFDEVTLLWLQATIGYLWYEAPQEKQNISTLLKILRADVVREDDEFYENAIDILFAELEKKNPKHFAVKQRKKYKKVAGKVAKDIQDKLGLYMSSKFDIPEVAELVSYDELHFDTYGDVGQKSILYVIISDIDTTYNFLPNIMFTQMFETLCYKGDEMLNGRLATPVQFILDDVAKIGKIYKFETFSTIMGRRSMSYIITMQTMHELEEIYENEAEIIMANCNSIIYTSSYEYFPWHMPLEHFVLPRNKCIVCIAGFPPFLSDMYDPTKHPNYKYTADYDERNAFCFVKDNDQYKVVI